ncbi:MAG: hypothetical protein Q8O93_00630 [bacterium]|nr:hypothetical protein [bacterium]
MNKTIMVFAIAIGLLAVGAATMLAFGGTKVFRLGGDSSQSSGDKLFRVEAELVGDAAEVTAKTEFTTSAVERNEIVSRIVQNLRADRQQIGDRLRIEVEDQQLSSRVRAEAKVENGRAEVKAEVRFVVNSADRAVIIEETFNRLAALEASEIDQVLELETR